MFDYAVEHIKNPTLPDTWELRRQLAEKVGSRRTITY
jgi:hypothetical protein